MPKFVLSGQPIWYDKFGRGPHTVLLIPGAIGTGKSDFWIQLDNTDNEHHLDFEQFTFICVELPGWGRSAPPKRNYDSNVFKYDAQCCIELMEVGFISSTIAI